ncbi:hypothetical protein SLE2022_262290 [Rubroshorea leprosula]
MLIRMADEEISFMLNRAHLTEDEDGILPLHSIWKLKDSKVEKLCLVGKIVSQKRINMNCLDNALVFSWNPGKAFKISEIRERTRGLLDECQ